MNIESLDKHSEEMKQTLEISSKELIEARKQISVVEETNNHLTNDIAISMLEKNELTQINQELSNKNTNYQDQLHQLTDANEVLNSSLSHSQSQFTVLDTNLNELKTTYNNEMEIHLSKICLLYTSPSPRDRTRSRMPSSA